MEALLVATALATFGVLFVGGLILLALFVRRAAEALLSLRDLREQTTETDERRATVEAAREAVQDIRRGAFGSSGDVDDDLLRAVHAEAAANGRPYRTDENERRNAGDEEIEEPLEPIGFYQPSGQQE
ncbi:MAG: hypothetical protein WA742_12525 [Candidatus Cybelea sp.]